MATRQEEALKILKSATSDDTVEVTRLEGGITVIKVIPQKKGEEKASEKGKWARVAEELAQENLLGDGRGDRLRKSIREFRDNFAFRDTLS